MGAKWSTVSTVTYADGSPSDDGAQTAANRVKFATIKTDLTDPLKTATDSIIAKLDERFNETTVAVSTNYTSTASDHTKILEVTGGVVTLLAASTAGGGYRVGVCASGGSRTVQRGGSDTINGVNSVVVPQGSVAWFTVNAAGNGYVADGVSGSTVRSMFFASGSYTGDGGTSRAVTGVGFAPKYVKVAQRRTADSSAVPMWETWAEVMDDNVSGGAIAHVDTGSSNYHVFKTDAIISLDSDGFTVDDNGIDAGPNTNGTIYNYYCMG